MSTWTCLVATTAKLSGPRGCRRPPPLLPTLHGDAGQLVLNGAPVSKLHTVLASLAALHVVALDPRRPVAVAVKHELRAAGITSGGRGACSNERACDTHVLQVWQPGIRPHLAIWIHHLPAADGRMVADLLAKQLHPVAEAGLVRLTQDGVERLVEAAGAQMNSWCLGNLGLQYESKVRLSNCWGCRVCLHVMEHKMQRALLNNCAPDLAAQPTEGKPDHILHTLLRVCAVGCVNQEVQVLLRQHVGGS